MIISIARKEFAEIVRDGRFKWTAAIMVLLLLTAMMAGYQKYTTAVRIQHAAQAGTNQQWLDQGDKNPHSAAHYGNYAFKPAGPLSYFDNGISNYTGTAVFMEAHKQNFAIGRPASDQSAIARFGDLSGANILQLLLPLLIIFLGFTSFSGERESGTLRQVLSMGVTNRQLLWGKALGVGSAVLIVVLPCILVGALALSMAQSVDHAEDMVTRVMTLSIAYLMYAGIFLFLTLAVSALTRHARTTLMVLVGFWAFTGFLMPKTASEISKFIEPTPAFGKWMADMRAHQLRGFDGVPPFAKFARYTKELFKEYGVSSVGELPMYFVAVRLQKLEEYDYPVFDQHYGMIREAYTSQRKVQDQLGILAPTLPLRSISMAISGTDLIQHVKFMTDAETYRRNMVVKMNDYLSKASVHLNTTYSSSNYMRADEEVFAIVPPFEFEPPNLNTMLTEHRSNFILLFLWLAASIGLAVFAANRISLERN
ncbi:MAG: ABC transporter permease subunit [Gammaproteobacteria bacterium]|jgi:ABC-2 type transport system permease protein|nr:ABC transporter permease subunit [Gammaproteobacteria bacterium]